MFIRKRLTRAAYIMCTDCSKRERDRRCHSPREMRVPAASTTRRRDLPQTLSVRYDDERRRHDLSLHSATRVCVYSASVDIRRDCPQDLRSAGVGSDK